MLFSLYVIGVLVIVYAIGYQHGSDKKLIRRYLRAIMSEQLKKPIAAQRAVDTSPGVVTPSKDLQPVVTDLSSETGGVVPMTPRAVALEENRRSQL